MLAAKTWVEQLKQHPKMHKRRSVLMYKRSKRLYSLYKYKKMPIYKGHNRKSWKKTSNYITWPTTWLQEGNIVFGSLSVRFMSLNMSLLQDLHLGDRLLTSYRCSNILCTLSIPSICKWVEPIPLFFLSSTGIPLPEHFFFEASNLWLIIINTHFEEVR